MRLLYCRIEGTLEEVPDLGREPGEGEVDPLVEALVHQHTARDPMGHGDVRLEVSPFRLFEVDAAEWRDNRKKIIDTVNKKNAEVGFDTWVYEARDTYREDALHCYSAHHRPKQGCIDWRDESKLLGHPTEDGRASAKESYKLAAKGPYLCDFCPVRSHVETEVNHRRGLYKDK